MSILRCFSHQCGPEAAARFTSWRWTETASWTGERTPAGIEARSASEICANACTKREHHSLFSPASSHSSTHSPKRHAHTHIAHTTHTPHTQIHTKTILKIHSNLHSLRRSFNRDPVKTFSLEDTVKNSRWASYVDTIYFICTVYILVLISFSLWTRVQS